MGTDEKIRQRDLWRGGAGLFAALLQERGVSLRASWTCRCGQIKENDSQLVKALGNSIRSIIADAQFRENYRIYGDTFAEQAIAQKRGRPRMERGFRIEGVDQDIRIQQNHGSRVSLRNSSEFIFGVRAADFIRAAI